MPINNAFLGFGDPSMGKLLSPFKSAIGDISTGAGTSIITDHIRKAPHLAWEMRPPPRPSWRRPSATTRATR